MNATAAVSKVLSVQGHQSINATKNVCMATRPSDWGKIGSTTVSRAGVHGFGSKLFAGSCSKVRAAYKTALAA